MKTVYYAHSMQIYNTTREQYEVMILSSMYDRVINPNGILPSVGWKQVACELIDSSDAVIVSEYRGHIGKGVCYEIYYALGTNKPVYVLRNCEMISVSSGDIEVVDINWAVRYARVNCISHAR